MKAVFRFLKSYKLLSLVLISSVASLILYFSGLHHVAYWVLGLATIAAVIPLLWDMISTLRNGRYGIDILAATAMITSVVLGQDWTGIIIALMLTGGEALEDFAENRAKKELTSLLNNKPQTTHLINNKGTSDIKVSLVKVNDQLSILPGEVIPVDGIILEGETSLNEASISGESLPVDKKSGDEVLSGAINIDGLIRIKVVRTAENSQYEQIIKLVKSAASSEAPFVRLADRYSVPFTVIAYLIAGSVWFTSGHAIRFLEVIVVATPCPLLLAAPIALISGMSRSAKHGIIVKNGTSLEKLAEIKTVAFDKTGTLTTGKPTISRIVTFNTYTQNDVLKYAASLEQNSNHVLASIIVSETNAKKIKFQVAKKVKEISGHGLEGRVAGKELLIGRLSLMQDRQVALPPAFNTKDIKNTTTYLAINKQLAGVITFEDQLRPEAKSLIKRLKEAGIKHFLIVTGDNLASAEAIGKSLGITDIKADCLPVDKIEAIENIEFKPVAFVGDGVNDAPVLTVSDIGIALGAQGSTAASESADVVILLDDVSKVASGLEIAKRTFFIAKQSILGGIFLSIALMVVFLTGHFKPIYGAVIQEVVDVIVIFNSLRALGGWQKLISQKTEKSL